MTSTGKKSPWRLNHLSWVPCSHLGREALVQRPMDISVVLPSLPFLWFPQPRGMSSCANTPASGQPLTSFLFSALHNFILLPPRLPPKFGLPVSLSPDHQHPRLSNPECPLPGLKRRDDCADKSTCCRVPMPREFPSR